MGGGRDVACGETDRRDDANSRLSRLCVCANIVAARHIAGNVAVSSASIGFYRS